jgi:DNA-binding MarR family transcriptional regulator
MDDLEEFAELDPWRGITPIGQGILSVLDAVGIQSAAKLAHRMDTSPDELEGELAQLVDHGYVHRERDAGMADAELSYQVTAEGRAALRSFISELHRRITDSE